MKKKIDKRTTKKVTKVKVSVTIDKKYYRELTKIKANISKFVNTSIEHRLICLGIL